LRFLILAAAFLLPLAACTRNAEEVLPISASIKAASQVVSIEIVLRPPARRAIAPLDERIRARRNSTATMADTRPSPSDYDKLEFERLMVFVVEDTTRAWGLNSGRAVKLLIEIDEVRTPNAAAAFIGRQDRLAGSVFVRDKATGEPLGQLYVDISSRHSGLMGLVLRGTGVREQLAEAFAAQIADALGGRPPKSN
jgi:hypothetical protein